MTELSKEELLAKIENKENFLLDLYATWCGPCKILMKNLSDAEQKLKSENKTKYSIYKFDIESDREFVVNNLKIKSVPTLKLFKRGEEVFSNPGLITTNQILEIIENH